MSAAYVSSGSVELLSSMGSDLDVVNAARVSYAKESDWERFCSECGVLDPRLMHGKPGTDGTPGYICPGFMSKRLKEADVGLINYLMKNRHGTPFEMVQFKFRVKCPIGVAREWQRHRIGSFNEVSTRYVEMEQDFYLPDLEDVRKQVGKPGHYQMKPLDESSAMDAVDTMRIAYDYAFETYRNLIRDGVAKELARNVLPLGLMTQFVWLVNARSLMNFLSLRTHETALLEIRKLARLVESEFEKVLPVTHAAWVANDRVAP